MGSLDGRVAIITGGGNGIGAAISRRFAAEGAKLVINDLGTSTDGVGGDEGPAKNIAEEIVANGGHAESDGGDIADVATGERLVAKAVDAYGKLDIVVNVAGILRDRMIFNLDESDWDAVVRVHLKGHYSTLRPASAYWRQQRNPDADNRVINFTSLSGIEGSPTQPNYSAAKMGVIGLTWSLARSLTRYGVTTNAIAPGAATRLTATVPTDKAPEGFSVEPSADPAFAPENVATVATYLASERSRWLNGRILMAQGYHVGLYNFLEEVEAIDGDSAWDLDALGDQIEKQFRPVGEGMPPSMFDRPAS